MGIASINFKPIKSNSKVHNERLSDNLDYVRQDLSRDNLSWKNDEINSRYQSIVELTKEKTGRSIQAKATPIREAVVNVEEHHTIEDMKRLTDTLKSKYGIDCFQIFIHRDEGHWNDGNWKTNHHAHLVFDWQDKTTGKSFKLHKQQMSEIQTVVSEVLGMKRGELKENSNRERLEPIEYKRKQEELKLHKLQQQTADLEQKKNEVRVRIERLTAERKSSAGETNSNDDRARKEAFRELILASESLWTEKGTDANRFEENELIEAISILEREISNLENGI